MCSSVRRSTAGSLIGASTGCSVKRTWSPTISAGARSTQGTSGRTPRQVLPARQNQLGSHVNPASLITTLRPGNLWNTPSATRLRSCVSNAVDCAM